MKTNISNGTVKGVQSRQEKEMATKRLEMHSRTVQENNKAQRSTRTAAGRDIILYIMKQCDQRDLGGQRILKI